MACILPCRCIWPSACARRHLHSGENARYKEISDGIMEIFRSFSPLVEQLSVDEAFLDVTGMEGLYPDVVALGKAVKKQNLRANRLACFRWHCTQ